MIQKRSTAMRFISQWAGTARGVVRSGGCPSVGERVDVQTTSLYRYVASREQLFDLVVG